MEEKKQNRQMRRYAAYCAAFVVLVFCTLFTSSCTKPEEVKPVVVDTLLPAPTAATGTIREFTIDDSLIGHGKQTVIKWYVDGTNSLTEVKLNGVKVMFSGAIQSGPLTKNTVFTLTINNNKQASKMVHVADSMATLLWNGGIRWKTVGTRTKRDTVIKGSMGQDSTIEVWDNTFATFNGKFDHFRTSFYLDGNSLEEQLLNTLPKPNPSGTYVVQQVTSSPLPNIPATGHAMFWKTKVFYIDTLSLAGKEMVLFVDSNKNGKITFNRIRYVPEF